MGYTENRGACSQRRYVTAATMCCRQQQAAKRTSPRVRPHGNVSIRRAAAPAGARARRNGLAALQCRRETHATPRLFCSHGTARATTFSARITNKKPNAMFVGMLKHGSSKWHGYRARCCTPRRLLIFTSPARTASPAGVRTITPVCPTVIPHHWWSKRSPGPPKQVSSHVHHTGDDIVAVVRCVVARRHAGVTHAVAPRHRPQVGSQQQTHPSVCSFIYSMLNGHQNTQRT